jgi:hypothetical protein
MLLSSGRIDDSGEKWMKTSIQQLDCSFIPSEINVTNEKLIFHNNNSSIQLNVPKLEVNDLQKIIEVIRENRDRYVKNLSTNDIISIIDRAIGLWLDQNFIYRRLAEEYLPTITGYDEEMIHLFLSKYLRNFRKEKLQRMVEEDFPNPLVLDEFRPRRAGGLYRAYGPKMITHFFSGNVPGLPLYSLVAGMLVKSATLGKVSSSEPLFPVLFMKTIEMIAPNFAKSMAVVWWKGGDEELENKAFSQTEAVIAYGSDQSIQDIKRRVPYNVNFYPHGHKVSFGVITKEALTRTLGKETARRAAHDASWFDQQGCLSPHVFFVEREGDYSPKEFMGMLANEMRNVETKMPRAKLSPSENNLLIQARSKAEFQSFTNTKVAIIHSENSTAWTVVYQEDDGFPLSTLNRFITVVPIHSIEELPKELDFVREYLQTAGVASSPARFQEVINLLGELGINRICFLGNMSNPEPGWHHDGRFSIADLVRWVDVESTVEETMDTFDPFRD